MKSRYDNYTDDALQEELRNLISYIDMTKMSQEVAEFELVDIADSVEEAVVRQENPDMVEGILTGYQGIDRATGGFANEELIIIFGGTGQGKSLLSQTIMMNMALDGVKSLFFTLEMPPVETTYRLLKMSEMFGGKEVLATLPIKYYYGTNVSLPILDKAIEKGVADGVKVVFIDHLHFFAKGGDNQAAEIGYIVREIKLMARKYKLPIVLISHVRKMSSPDKVPDFDDCKDSSAIGQDSDIGIAVWRNMNTVNEEEQKVMKVVLRKNRRRGHLPHLQVRMDDKNYLREEKYGHATTEEF